MCARPGISTSGPFYVELRPVMRERCPLSGNIRALSEVFASRGYSLYLVGGAVRDYLLSLPNDDYDFATDARPQEVMDLFPHHVIPTGLQHGTVTVRFRKSSYEITTFRSESSYSDSRHPDSVTFVRSLESDLERRDFTINALAVDCRDGRIIDMHDGRGDLKRKLVRAIGRPDERFSEDALRMLRACRFAAKLGFTVETETFNAMCRLSGNIVKVSGERIREELFRIICSPHPAAGIELMRRSGLLHWILPELEACHGVEQMGLHHMDVYHHQLAALEVAREHSYPPEVRLAALLHDIGKPECRTVAPDGGSCTFYGHDRLSGEKTDVIMRRLKCSNAEREKVVLLVREHMFNYTSQWSDGAVRRFVSRVGKDNITDLIRLRIADAQSISSKPVLDPLWELEERVRKILEEKEPLGIRDLAIGGRELMALGVPQGPQLGRVLNQLLDLVLEDAALNTKENLRQKAQEIISRS